MLNILTEYSTMVTNGSTGSTTHVPVMPRAKGFCITTHKQTQEARKKQLFLLVHLRGNKKAAAFNSALPCALDITRSPKWPRSGKKSAALPGALFLVAISSASSTRERRRRPQKTWFIRMAIATNTTEFLLLPTCPTPTVPLSQRPCRAVMRHHRHPIRRRGQGVVLRPAG